jgi:FkbM family methyltransferase
MAEFVCIRGHTFLRQIGPTPLVVDVGANHGAFSRTCEVEFGARTILVEANPDLTAMLRSRYQNVLGCAVSGEDGVAEFNLSDNHEASSLYTLPETSQFGGRYLGTVEVPVRRLDGLLKGFDQGPIAVLKLDIEGGEFAALRSLSGPLHHLPAQITVEFHSAREFGLALGSELAPTLVHMKRLGFIAIDFSAPRHMDVLFVNPEFHPAGRFRRLYWALRYQLVAPYVRALRYRLKLRSRLKQLLHVV